MTHPPDPQGRPCIACTDPDKFEAWQASQRSQADQYGQWSETLRAAGQVMGERSVWAVVRDEDPADFDALQRRLCGDANALASRTNTIRDQVDAVTAAHAEPVQTDLHSLATDRRTT